MLTLGNLVNHIPDVNKNKVVAETAPLTYDNWFCVMTEFKDEITLRNCKVNSLLPVLVISVGCLVTVFPVTSHSG